MLRLRLRLLLCAAGLAFGACILSPIEDLPSGDDDSGPGSTPTGGVSGTGAASPGSGGGAVLPGAGGGYEEPNGGLGGGGAGGAGGEMP
jgi:hypothetical protein